MNRFILAILIMGCWKASAFENCSSVLDSSLTPTEPLVIAELPDNTSPAVFESSSANSYEASPYTAEFFPEQRLSVHGNQSFSLKDIQLLKVEAVKKLKDYISQNSTHDEEILKEIRTSALIGLTYLDAALPNIRGLQKADLTQFSITDIATEYGPVPGFQLKVQIPRSFLGKHYTVPTQWTYFLPWAEQQALDFYDWSVIQEMILNQVSTTVFQLESDRRVFELLESIRGISYYSSKQPNWKKKKLMKIMIQNSEDYINGRNKGSLVEVFQKRPNLLARRAKEKYSGRNIGRPLAYTSEVAKMNEYSAFKILTEILEEGVLYRSLKGYKLVSRKFVINLYFDREGSLKSMGEGWGLAPTNNRR